MKCIEAIQYLVPYIDSELDPTTTFHIQAHLSICAACSKRYSLEAQLEARMSRVLRGAKPADSGSSWMNIVQRSFPQHFQPTRRKLKLPAVLSKLLSIEYRWIPLLSSLGLLAPIMSAGKGWHHELNILPHASDYQVPAELSDAHTIDDHTIVIRTKGD